MNDITTQLLTHLSGCRVPGQRPAGPRVTVVGDLNFDVIHLCPPLRAGQRVLLQERRRCLGGAAGVTACGLARLGASVRVVSRVGEDGDGRELLEELQERGVETAWVQTAGGAHRGAAEGATAFTLIFTRPGEPSPRQVATFRGTLAGLSLEGLEPEALFRGADALYACNYFILPALSDQLGKLFAGARAAGLLTAYDANAGDGWGDPERLRVLTQEIYPHTDVVFLNEEEAAALSGTRDCRRALRDLCPHAGTLVIKRGGRGALVRHRGRRFAVGEFPVAGSIRDTVGAGDSFQAGFLYFLLKGVPVEHAALLAGAGAASTLLRHGGTGGQLDRAGLRRFVSRYRVLDCGDGRLMVEPRKP
ncbi:MAG: hypothetical protein JW820_11370 [Spirochaetales bacterium]|nr:hypothetical protein [Spirochaetales bacterium]